MKNTKKITIAEDNNLVLGFPSGGNINSHPTTSTTQLSKSGFHNLNNTISAPKPTERIIKSSLGNRPIMYSGDSHLMTIAPTGAGKNRSVIIPNLLRYRGPVIVIDPKGENYAVTAKRRKEMGQKVIVLDPFCIMVEKSDCLNPMDIFDLHNSNLETDAQLIAELLSDGAKFSKDPFWDLSAGGIISGIIAYIVKCLDREDWTINKLRDVLMNDDTSYELAKTLDNYKQEKIGRMAYQEIASFLQMSAKETRSSVLATAVSYLKAFTSDQVAATLNHSSFPLREVVEGNALSIYIIIPPDKLKSHKAILKLWISTLLKAIISRKEIPKQRTLFLLDECGQLGNFPMLETAITLLRGYGLQTWTFWQDLSQLKKYYPVEWPTMVNNCAVLQMFGTKNFSVASELSKLVGVKSSDIMGIANTEQILMLDGDELLLSKKPDYLKDAGFKGKFEPNPMYNNYKAR